MDPLDDDAALVAATIPVVLRVMPLLSSPALVGYIYDPTHSPDGRLLVAAFAFFSHHGHQVFLDPCLDLVTYCRAGGITATIINVDWLPDHVLSEGLNLLEPPSSSSKVDTLSTSFMAAYLPAPALAVPQGLVSFSPIGGSLAGQSLSFLGSTRDGESMGSIRSFHLASSSPLASSHSIRLVGPSSCPPDSWGERCCPDPEPGEQFSSWAPSFGSGRVSSSIGYGGHYGGQVACSPSSPSSSAGLLYGGSPSFHNNFLGGLQLLRLLCSFMLAYSWGIFILRPSFSLSSWGVVYSGGTFPQGHGGFPRAATLVAPSLAFAGSSLHPSLPQEDHHSSSGSDITMSFSSPGQGLPPPLSYHPRTRMTISIGTATNVGWSMGLPPWDVSSSFEFGSQASLGILLVSLFF
jgi:hypothetical protein